MGAAMPVRATADDRKRLALKAFKLLEMPPKNMSADVAWIFERLLLILTFVYNQYQPKVA
jgi:hypothetical protein